MRPRFLRTIFSSPLRAFASLALLALIVIAVIGPAIWGVEGDTPNPTTLNAPPGGDHIAGTDALGRDVLARVLAAGQISLLMALSATAIGVVLGTLLGAVPVVLGRRSQRILASVLSTWMAFPVLLVALFITILLGPGTVTAVIAMGLTMTPSFGRFMQTLAAEIESADYVVAGRMLGIRRGRLFRRYILPNISEPVLVYVTISIGNALLAMSALSFLGLGVQAPNYDWGRMLGDALPNVYTSPWAALIPGIAIVFAGITFGLAGEALASLSRNRGGAARPPRGVPTPQSPSAMETSATRLNQGNESNTEAHLVSGRSLDGEPLLSVRHLSVHYPTSDGWVSPVRDVSLTINRGEIVGVVGESGSGKSVTSMAINRLITNPGQVQARQLSFDGIDLLGIKEKDLRAKLGSRIATIFQDPMTYLNPALRIGTQLTEVLEGRSTRAEARERAIAGLKELRMTKPAERLNQFPAELSGGMRQRVLIAMAQIADADLIIADEPTTALDMTVQHHVLAALRKRCRENGSSALVVSHDIGVLVELCTRLVVMYAGRIVEEISVEQLLRQGPAHPYTEALLASLPTLETPVDKPLVTLPGQPPHPGETFSGCAMAPRCPFSTDECRTVLPQLELVRPATKAACLHPRNHAIASTERQNLDIA
ncbi:peptide ABC transporter ATP-binding protein [Arthrobacter sp. MYb23]|uniref:dipeptide/oligopeptide/nickel ABC transporter permease/ATP-binding protein n=1 Tax=unclassified Arthrobacter TaxID=235627 RepID=UPI000CFB5682|nr:MULTISPECIES: dipeptide/oligopeptide/nickel ABC transporter permease/ATP-binding protein [unclassified Arthrobacter]PRB43060.1 peptide ABC transporter ATP-binding protein [Arthrobacter sp. MYb51]PRB98012.1 peptide ABC transporter ATP-binding protein [Arthrobacter sp. MYb23]